MSTVVNVTSINVLAATAPANSPFKFEITFESAAALKEELEWKLVYVGSAEDEKFDQELESVLVGPVALGKNKFVFDAPAPDFSKIPSKDMLGVTVVLLTCSYREREFLRVGYYINTFYGDEALRLSPPAVVIPWRDEEQASAAAVGIFPLPPAGPVGVEPEPEEGDMTLTDENEPEHEPAHDSAAAGAGDDDRELEGMRIGHSHSASSFGFARAAAAAAQSHAINAFKPAEEHKTPARASAMDFEDY